MSLSQIRLFYNPQLQSAEITEKLFVVRRKQFEFLLNKILQEKNDNIPQHYLIIGQRGMGKTTLLKRMEVELHKEQYRQQFIPLLYREEQYNVKDLAEFWLNTLDALADSLQIEKYPADMLAGIDQTIRELSGKTVKKISEEAYAFLIKTCRDLSRRPVLLIDNINLVFHRLDNNNKNKTEQWALRKLLSENGAPIVVSAGVTVTTDVADYGMPFYDFFQIQYLKRLNYDEFITLLKNLATVTDSESRVFDSILENNSRQKALQELTGGSPRLTVMLFEQIARGFSNNINDDLEILADAVTPLYKAKFEELPPQQQIIIDAIALNWDAISLRKLAVATRMQNNQLSPQLKRLIDEGWIETTPAYKAKGNAYFISERFFNIYYLIRNSSRRHKDKIYCLSKFLESFYGKEELERISDNLLQQDICSKEQMQLHLAFWDIKALGKKKQKQGKEKISETFLRKENKELRKEFDFPEETYLLAEGKRLLKEDKCKEAIISYDKALKTNPNIESIWFSKAQALKKLERYEEVILCLDTCIEINPKEAVYWAEKGEVLSELDRYEEALNCFNKAIKLKPEDQVLLSWRILCLLNLQHIEEALNYINKIIKLNQNEALFWSWKGLALNSLQRFEESVECFDQALKLNPENDRFWSDKGWSLFSMKQYIEANNCYKEAIKLNPENKTAWLFNGICLFEMKQYKEAIDSLDKYLKINPDGSAWKLKGDCLLETQCFEDALICYDKAIEFDPNNYSAINNKAYALIELKKYKEAAETYEQALTIEPQKLFIIFALLFLYRDKLNKIDRATELFNSIDEQELNQKEDAKQISRYYLHKALFELYQRNEGLAKEHLLHAFQILAERQEIAVIANEHWWIKSGSVIINLGYGSWLLAIMEEKGYDIVLSPYYTAIQALEIEKQDDKKGKADAEMYLSNRATEINEPARIIIEKIRNYMD